jgi:NADH-quinone oxidoreductase subunit M
MSFFTHSMVSLVIFSPLLFAGLVFLLPQGERGQIRAWTLVGMMVNFGLTLGLYFLYDPHGAEFQLQERSRWLSDLGMSYHVGVDGLAVSLMLLTGLLGPILVLGSWTFIEERVKEFHLALLLIQTAMLGALGALDLILFYVFFEAMLIPMYLLVGVWGSEERVKAAVKFFLYTLVGSLVMLVAILAVYFMTQPAGARSFDYADVYNALIAANRQLGAGGELSPLAMALRAYGPLMFFAFALAFAIKVPMFPVHTWLPDAHVQAPVAGSIILAGVMLKMGTFGFWRYAIPLFPASAYAMRPVFVALSLIGIIYGALMCLAQKDIKKLIAYSSVSHLGYCMLGIFAFTPEGATGSAYQMLNHGVSTGALFLLFGFLYERRHTRLMSEFGGIAKVMPLFAATFVLVTFSSIAVPGTNGFVGEFLVLLGTFKAEALSTWTGVLATTGVILGAAYMLWMVQKVFFGPLSATGKNAHLGDLGPREATLAFALIAVALFMGLVPQPFLDRIAPSTARYVSRASLGMPGKQGVTDKALNIEALPLPPEASPSLPPASSAAVGQP